MKKRLLSLKFWEVMFIVSLILYIVDDIFLFSAFFVTIPLEFLIGVVTCVFSVKEKKYIHTIICIIGMFLPILKFMLTPW